MYMKKILVIEDTDAIRSAIVFVLKTKFYEVLEAGDGFVGLDIINDETKEIDLIILDLKMPYLDGVNLLKEIRFNTKYAELPIIIYSAYVDEYSKPMIEDLANNILEKPIDVPQLIELVEFYLGPGKK